MPFNGYSIEGVTLWRVTSRPPGRADAPSRRWIAGTDAQGRELRGEELFRRAGALPPEQLARRALDLLLRQEGQEWLMPGVVPRDVEVMTGQEIAAPQVSDGRLVFWTRWGRRNPSAARVVVDLATGVGTLDGEPIPAWSPPAGHQP